MQIETRQKHLSPMVKAIIKKLCWQGPRDMAQWLRVCLALTGDGSSNPCTYVGRLQLQEVQGEPNPLVSEGICTHTHRHTYKAHKTKKEISFKRTVDKNALPLDYKAGVALGNILSHFKAKVPFDSAFKKLCFYWCVCIFVCVNVCHVCGCPWRQRTA